MSEEEYYNNALPGDECVLFTGKDCVTRRQVVVNLSAAVAAGTTAAIVGTGLSVPLTLILGKILNPP
jgi:hypothetical protein